MREDAKMTIIIQIIDRLALLQIILISIGVNSPRLSLHREVENIHLITIIRKEEQGRLVNNLGGIVLKCNWNIR